MSRPLLLRITLFSLTAMIIIVSAIFVHYLSRHMRADEQQKIELWAEATRQFILADERTDIDLISRIIESNNTIPVYMTDELGNVLLSRNDNGSQQAIARRVLQLRQWQEPIRVPLGKEQTQYIYYGESTMLKTLHYVPIVQFAFIIAILVLAFMAYSSLKNAEQQRVWLGLSKETAHQLGTPVSSLNAWIELLAARYPNDDIVPEIRKDTDRLQTISQRFSKIGSTPELKPTDINAVLRDAVNYMQQRTSNQIVYQLQGIDQPQIVMLNPFLFNWAIENLCKNAVDAMEGRGTITLRERQIGSHVVIDIADTGKGIADKDVDKIFQPGYTTKQRGWGLGLSLTRRIIQDYHKGKIYVLKTEPQRGTTFRIEI